MREQPQPFIELLIASVHAAKKVIYLWKLQQFIKIKGSYMAIQYGMKINMQHMSMALL